MAVDLIESPVLIPTAQGPAGGIVCEPAEPRGALILLQGGGRSGRSGFNSGWAVLARALAGLGVTVLRYDFWHEGDSSMITADRYPAGTDLASNVNRDRALLGDVAAWFRQRTEGLDLLVAGSCYGARLGLELAAQIEAVSLTMLVVPYLRRFEESQRGEWRERMLDVRRGRSEERSAGTERNEPDLLDPEATRSFEAALRQGGVWVLIGERDAGEVLELEAELADRRLELTVEAAAALYPGSDPQAQAVIRDRIAARLLHWLGQPAPSRPSS
jgi:alpha/beta superfamily hydrolase